MKLWEHADRIRSGELGLLAPLLLLCEDGPVEETIHREMALIRAAAVTEPQRADLLSLAMSVAARYMAREMVFNLFREDAEMLKEAGVVEDWIAEGEFRGELRKARQSALRVLRGRFGELPASVVQEVEVAEMALCDRIIENIWTAKSLGDLGLE